jgi:hypothetical protein
MAGSLFHSREFRLSKYIGNDGLEHHEVLPVDGDIDVVSYSSWEELKKFGLAHGIPPDAWPEFLDHDSAIDIELTEIVAASDRFRTHLDRFDRTAACPYWFSRILDYIDAGQRVFFC